MLPLHAHAAGSSRLLLLYQFVSEVDYAAFERIVDEAVQRSE